MSDWTPLTDDELTEAETSALDTALEAVTQWGAGTVTASGRNRHGEVKWSATVADVDGRMVGFVIRPDEDDEGDVLNVVVATVPADAVVIPRSAIPDGLVGRLWLLDGFLSDDPNWDGSALRHYLRIAARLLSGGAVKEEVDLDLL